ncbi:MAG: transketolase [Solirubrobacteraceae bacterium]|jgi:transketolase|nr:transketolase [Solirubrobacteraceae bacterium]
MTATEAPAAAALDRLCIDTIRMLALDAVAHAGSGDAATAMALAPVGYVLSTRVMRHSPEHPDWPDRDRLVLSAGHAAILLYALLHLTGYGLSVDDLRRFRRLGSPTPGHPEYGTTPGVEATTGPPGQGVGTSVGLALAERMLNARLGDEVIDHYTFCIACDGDLQEGIASEAAALAGHLGLARLVLFHHEGDASSTSSEVVTERYEASGWHVQHLAQDPDPARIESAAWEAMAVDDRPSLVVVPARAASGAPEDPRRVKAARGWPAEPPFHVPDEALAHFRRCVERGRGWVARWEQRSGGWRGFELADGWDAGVPRFSPRDVPAMATRRAGAETLRWAERAVEHLVGGSVDPAGATLQAIGDGAGVRRGAYGARNVAFGAREHAVGAVVNGLVLSDLRAFGATFLVLGDDLRAAIRLASLMRIPSIFVLTHDSIGVGEDGPAHQPVEQVAALRAQPNLHVVRPADANETALAYRFALRQARTPTAIVLTRQDVPVLAPDDVPDAAIERGAYVLRDPDRPDAILVASGSEVHLCLRAATLLERDGIRARVVSMPCLERFEEQDAAYRDRVLPPAVRARVCVEALSPLGWHRHAGDAGEVIGMTTFGASAPAEDLLRHFGFTPERVAETARAVVARTEV